MSPKEVDTFIARGKYSASPFGTLVFIGLRTFDIFVQTVILTNGATVLAGWGIPTVKSNFSYDLSPPIALGLGLKPLMLVAFAAGSTLKQIFWLTVTAGETMSVGTGIMISVFNTVVNSLNSLISLWAGFGLAAAIGASSRNQNELNVVEKAGVVLYAAGLLTEMGSETQRWAFKRDPRNKGKVYSGGLFSLARHINYGGYTIWRASYALVAGGPVWGACVAALFGSYFARGGIPELNEYCEKRVSSRLKTS